MLILTEQKKTGEKKNQAGQCTQLRQGAEVMRAVIAQLYITDSHFAHSIPTVDRVPDDAPCPAWVSTDDWQIVL